MLIETDPFDPRTWEEPEPFRRLWLHPEANIFCLVDAEDYLWALTWIWHPTPNSTGKKHYATRVTETRMKHTRKQTKLYLHKEILLRTGLLPPSKAHIIADHIDGDSLNNRRANLRWATSSENNLNRRRYS